MKRKIMNVFNLNTSIAILDKFLISVEDFTKWLDLLDTS